MGGGRPGEPPRQARPPLLFPRPPRGRERDRGRGGSIRLIQPLSSLRHQLIHDVLQIARALVGGELAIGAGALARGWCRRTRRRLRLPRSSSTSSTSSRSSRMTRSRHWHLLLLTPEVEQLAVDTPAHRAPFVLGDQVVAVAPPRLVRSRRSLMQLGDDRLNQCAARQMRLVDLGADVGDAELDRRELGVRTDVPPDARSRLRCTPSSPACRRTARTHSTSLKSGGGPLLGRFSKMIERYDLRPVLRPCQKGELVDNTSRCGRK